MEGQWRFYRKSGQLWKIGDFQNSKKHGTCIRLNKDNRQEYNEKFNDGKLIKAK